MARTKKTITQSDLKESTTPHIRNGKYVGQRIRYTPDETRVQMDAIDSLLTLGRTQTEVIRQANRAIEDDGLGISKSRAKTLIDRVFARWDQEDRERSSARRSEQARRIIRQIQNCQGERDPNNPRQWITKPDHAAIARYETILAKILGTEAPLEVEINVSHTETMAQVFAGYTLDRLQTLHARAEMKERLANAYLEEHPEAREVIDVEGVVVE